VNVSIWLLVGALVGLVNVFSIVRTVTRMRPGAPVVALWAVMGGFMARLALSLLALAVALRHNAAAGLLVFAGIWLARWVCIWSTRNR